MSKHCNTARFTRFEVKYDFFLNNTHNVHFSHYWNILSANILLYVKQLLVKDTVVSVVIFMYCDWITLIENFLCC